MSSTIEILTKFKEFLDKIKIKEKIIMTFLSLSFALLENLELNLHGSKTMKIYTCICIFIIFLYIVARFKKKKKNISVFVII